MYSRSYNDETIRIPEGYDGTALFEQRESPPRVAPTPDTPKREVKISPPEQTPDLPPEDPSPVFSEKKKSADGQYLSSLRGLLSSWNTRLGISLGSEELLIGAIALFLLISHDGDKLSAILLLALIFIT